MPDTIAQKLDFMRADIEEPGSSPAARLIAGHAALLLAAVEAAIGSHVEGAINMGNPFRYCSTCSGHPKWPCPEVAAITRELNGAHPSAHRGGGDSGA